jgi:sortase A
MTKSSRKFRRAEITLWIIGLSLLGVALGATVQRWSYQAEQERAFLRMAQASQLAPHETELATKPVPLELLELTADLEPVAEERAGSREPAIPERRASATRPPREGAPTPSLEDEVALDPGLMGRIEIPRLGLSAIVRKGDDEATLQRAIGHVAGTARPGEGGNTALAGHRDTFFRSLRRIKVDDRIRFVVPPHTYEYRVDSLRVVEPDELSVLDSTGTEELTLVTCYPFRYIGPAPDRFVVKATRIP